MCYNIASGCDFMIIYSEKMIAKMAKLVRRKLAKYPEFDKNSKDSYFRLQVEKDILERMLFTGDFLLHFDNLILRKLDLSEVDFAGKHLTFTDLSYTNANIDPQTVKYKDLACTNLEGVDLEGKDFTGALIIGANLKDTKATINPTFVKYGSIKDTNLEGCQIVKPRIMVKKR